MGRVVATYAPECPEFLGSCQVANFCGCISVAQKREVFRASCAEVARPALLFDEDESMPHGVADFGLGIIDLEVALVARPTMAESAGNPG